jgi:hypothetical protein
MTDAIEFHQPHIEANPLDRIEEILIANDWTYNRLTMEELSITMHGENGEYNIVMNWFETKHALKLCCQIQNEIPQEKLSEAILISTEINQSLFAGHFSIPRDEALPCFYYSAFFKDEASIGDTDYLEWIMHTALDQCERFAPLFQWLGTPSSNLNAGDLSLVLMETAGRA